MAVATKLLLADIIGGAKRGVRIADERRKLKSHISAMRLMNQRFALQRFLDIHHRRQRFINHIDRFRRILGQIAAFRQHHRHRIAHITNLAVSQRILQKPQQIAISPQPHRNRPRLHHRRNVIESNHIHHARHRPRRRGVNGKNAGMSVRAAHNNRVQHIRQLDIIHKPPPPGKKPPIFLAPQRGADISLRHIRPQFTLRAMYSRRCIQSAIGAIDRASTGILTASSTTRTRPTARSAFSNWVI